MQPVDFLRTSGSNVSHVVRGTSWNGLYKILAAAIVLFKTSILARMLSPEDFGVFSLILIALGLMEAMTETGINITILQSKQSVRYFLDTAWVIAIARGFLIGILMILSGFGMRWFYADQQLLLLIGIASLIPVIKGFINPAIVQLQKEFSFFYDSLYRLSLTIFEAIGMIVFVWITDSVLGLIAGIIFAAFAEVIVSFIFFQTRPQFAFISSRAKTIFNNAKGLTLTAALSYIEENVDNLIIGKLLDTGKLGLYDRGYTLTHKVLEVPRTVYHSTVPVYVQITEDTQRLRKAFLRSSIPTLVAVTGALLPFFFFPETIVEIILGDQWLAVIPILPLLAVAVWTQTVNVLFRSLLISVKSYRYINGSLLLTVISLIVFLLWLTPLRGLEGAVVSVILSRVLGMPFLFWGIWKALFSSPASRKT